MTRGAPIVYVSGAVGVPRDAAFMHALGERFRVFAYDGSTETDAMAEFIRTAGAGPVHLIAESESGAAGCRLAIQYPALVQSLVLVAPTAFDANLLEHLSEITAPTLVVWGTADEVVPPENGQLFLQCIPNSYRILIYGAPHSLPAAACRQFVALTTDFIERGDRFVVAEPES